MYPKREKKYKGNYKPRKDRECLYANEENDFDEHDFSVSDDEIEFVVVKEEILEKVALVSQVENKSNWIIDSGCSHHMTSDMLLQKLDGGIVRFGNNVACQVKGIRSITLDGKTNMEDLYFLMV